MIYLAILLILCGLLILITALSIETGIVKTAGDGGINKSADSCTAAFASEEVEIIFPDDRTDEVKDKAYNEHGFISFEDETADREMPEPASVTGNRDERGAGSPDVQQRGELFQGERRKLDSYGRPGIIEKRENAADLQKHDSAYVSAVMFDDRSNIIDYESGVGAIDSTFSKYKSIKRIGRGKIESDYDGVSFYIDEKLYRFDFHKVYDIWSGSDYIALPLKGNSTVKLFIIENSAGFPYKVEADFKEYEKGL